MVGSPAKGSPESLRRQNRHIILNYILGHHRLLSRTQIAEETGLTGAAVSRIIRELIDVGILKEGTTFGSSQKPGRRFVELKLTEDGAFVLGLGISADEQWVSLANLQGQIMARARITLGSFEDPVTSLGKIALEAEKLIKDQGIARHKLLGGGVSIAGIVDPLTGVVLDSPNLGWRVIDIGPKLEEALGLPFRVEGHPNALNMAERRNGVSAGKKNVVLVNVALGIGGSLISDGNLVRGRANAAGRIGHIPMPGAKDLCKCGRVGCLDTVASGQAILKQLGFLAPGDTSQKNKADDAEKMRSVIRQLEQGDHRIAEVFFQAGTQLGLALNSVSAVTDPEVVVLAGPVARTKKFGEGVRSQFLPQGLNGGRMDLLISNMTRDTAAILMALEHYVFSQNLCIDRLKNG